MVAAGIQYLAADGRVDWVLGSMQAPNDLVVGLDKTLYFTDPIKFPPPPDSAQSRVMALSPDGTLRVLTDQLHFCNGIACEPDGTVVITERNGLMRIHADGTQEWIIENLSDQPATDGLCVDVEGRFYLAAELDNGIRVVEGNKVVDFLPIPGGGMTTNCCFGGPGNRWLFATDGMKGTVVRWTDMPTPGLPATPWPTPVRLRDSRA
jgi:sugar lactone lactonase YvrE